MIIMIKNHNLFQFDKTIKTIRQNFKINNIKNKIQVK